MKYEVTWTELREYKCSVTVEADSEDQAYDLACDCDIPDKEEDTMKEARFGNWVKCEEVK